MNKSDHNNPWYGRDDTVIEGQHAVRWHQRVEAFTALSPPGHAIVGFCCDQGVLRNGGRAGAAAGPAACRRALANFAWHARPPIYDVGDIGCHDDALEEAQNILGVRVAELLTKGHTPLVIGGGHEVAWGTWQGIAAARTGASRVGIINVDAHFDMRRSLVAHSGTPFAQIERDCARRDWPFRYLCLGIAALSNSAALFETAQRSGTQWLLDEEFTMWNHANVERTLSRFLDSIDRVYLTICLDAFSAATAPGVSAPAARGVAVAMVEWLIDVVRNRKQLLIAEVAELNPKFDQDQRTARLAARLLARAAGGAAVR